VVVLRGLLPPQEQVGALADVKALSAAYNAKRHGGEPAHVVKNGSNFKTLLGVTGGELF
jgi:hypothetical protein